MLSPIYRLIANRATFDHAGLSSEAPFTPVTAGVHAVKVRSILRLDDEQSDFALVGVTGALLGQPQLMARFGHRIIGHPGMLTSFSHSAFTPPTGVRLVNSGAGAAQVLRQSTRWPINMQLKVTRLDEFSAEVAFSVEESERVPCRLSGDTLIIEWPRFAGLHGYLHLDHPTSWTGNVEYEFYVEPVQFPCEAAVREVLQGTAWMHLLEPHGLLPVFAGVRGQAQESLGVIALGLALDTIANS